MSLIDSASLIVTPNAYKEGTLYSVIPSDGSGDLSVTRATTATRVNSQGLVELVPYNLLSRSEEFNDAIWSKYNATITSNSTTAPNDTLTAEKIAANGTLTSSFFYLSQAHTDSIVGQSYTATLYAKAGTVTQMMMYLGAQNGIYWNLSNGQFISYYNGVQNITAYNSESIGNGWYRYTISINATITTIPLESYSAKSGNLVGNYTTADNYYIWGAQLVEGSSAIPYQKTETRLNIPRLDYSNGTCPSILVEPQRTNYFPFSQDITSWPTGGMTNTANQTTSPDGTQNADKSTIGSVTRYYDIVSQSFTTISGTTYTTSFFAKKGTGIESIYFYENSGVRIAKWNLNDGSYIGHAPSNGYSAFSSYGSESVGNGWYRFWATYTASSSGAGLHVGVSTNTNNSVTPITGNGTDFVYVWGLQYEAGSYPTSYIPTTSASVTRNADVISKTGISSLIGQTEGTIYFDGVVNGCENAAANLINSEKNTNASFSISYIKSNLRIQASIFASGVEYNLQGGSINIGQTVKVAYAYKSGNSALYVNGVQVASSSSTFTIPSTLDDIFIGDPATYFAYQEAITNNATVLWKTRLTNDELERLTGVGFNTYTEMANYYNYITQ